VSHLAESLAKHGITVNAYAPGGVRTDMRECCLFRVKAYNHGEHMNIVDDVLGNAVRTLPLSDPGEIAGLVSYLVKDEAKFITGEFNLFCFPEI
jgi:NAD(P)-dependent dehydrogenase (short-subunit alcohol dehydrogenase family)